jgi:HAD superfamily hydrolase (TIGR01484 family)
MALRIPEHKLSRICRSWWGLWSGGLEMNIKMIATDLDGTLLRTDKTISNYTIDILKKLREIGIKIVFATARSMAYLADYLSQIEIDSLCFSNGSAVMESGIEIKRCTFEKAD